MGFQAPSDPQFSVGRNCSTTQALLQHKDGDCFAWAAFLTAVSKCQGIDAKLRTIELYCATNDPQNPTNALLKFNGNDIVLTALLAPENAGKHHNKLPMERRWTTHKIVEYAGAYYDPSYGKKYSTQLEVVHAFFFEYEDRTLSLLSQTTPGTNADVNWIVIKNY